MLVNGRAETYAPKWLNPPSQEVSSCRRVKRYASLAAWCEEHSPEVVVVKRTYAMGDVVMLLPVMSAFMRLFPCIKATIILVGLEVTWAIPEAMSSVTWWPKFRVIQCRGRIDYGMPIHIDLDASLEKDHLGGEESKLHRMELYARSLGVRL